MKKTMLFSFTVALLASAFMFSSCENSQETLYYSHMTAVVSETDEYPCYFITDDSIRINPLNYKELDLTKKIKMNDRLFGTFTVPDGNINVSPVNAEISSLAPILTKDILYTNKPDTVGRDGIRYMGCWLCGGIDGTDRFITMDFGMDASNMGIPHIVNLVSLDSDKAVDDEGYYNLHFYHDANHDPMDQTIKAFASFRLDDELLNKAKSGLRITYTDVYLEEQTLTIKF